MPTARLHAAAGGGSPTEIKKKSTESSHHAGNRYGSCPQPPRTASDSFSYPPTHVGESFWCPIGGGCMHSHAPFMLFRCALSRARCCRHDEHNGHIWAARMAKKTRKANVETAAPAPRATRSTNSGSSGGAAAVQSRRDVAGTVSVSSTAAAWLI